MFRLLATLIIARQEIDRTEAYERRSAAGVKGAAKRKAGAAKNRGGR
jgi:hypothetical protein